jgi:hypothetical protein
LNTNYYYILQLVFFTTTINLMFSIRSFKSFTAFAIDLLTLDQELNSITVFAITICNLNMAIIMCIGELENEP